MGINLQLPSLTELRPRITVIGVGGAGGNAVNNMIDSGLEGVDFIAANTDAQALTNSSAGSRIQMGIGITEGLGAGSKPDIGAAAAEEALDEIRSHLDGVHMVFITAGMGGGTGTGAAPVIAAAARELGVLTVGVVTMPFEFEGQRRMRLAKEGVRALAQNVDTIIVIPNQNLFRIASEKTTFADAFMRADDVLKSGVSCITDLMTKEGLINLDFADVRTVMQNMGTALMGTGEAEGEKRALQAAESAISNPLLGEVSMRGARGLLVSITGSFDMTLYEVEEAASRIRREVDPDENPDVNIIVGATFDTTLQNRIRVSVVATGIGASSSLLDATRTPSHAPTQAQAGSKTHPRSQDMGGLNDRLSANAQPASHRAERPPQGMEADPHRTQRPQPILEPKPKRVPQPDTAARHAPETATAFQPVAPTKALRAPKRPLTFNDFPELGQSAQPEQRPEQKPRGFFDWMAGRSKSESGKPNPQSSPSTSVSRMQQLTNESGSDRYGQRTGEEQGFDRGTYPDGDVSDRRADGAPQHPDHEAVDLPHFFRQEAG
jgi:cell division protein FtsZ